MIAPGRAAEARSTVVGQRERERKRKKERKKDK